MTLRHLGLSRLGPTAARTPIQATHHAPKRARPMPAATPRFVPPAPSGIIATGTHLVGTAPDRTMTRAALSGAVAAPRI